MMVSFPKGIYGNHMDFEIRGRSFFSGQLVNINADLLFGANQLLMLPLVLSVTQQLAGARMTIDQRLGLVNRNRQIAASLNVVIVLTNDLNRKVVSQVVSQAS